MSSTILGAGYNTNDQDTSVGGSQNPKGMNDCRACLVHMLLLSYSQHCNDDRILCRKIMESDRSQVLGMAKRYAQLIKVDALRVPVTRSGV